MSLDPNCPYFTCEEVTFAYDESVIWADYTKLSPEELRYSKGELEKAAL